MERRVRLLALSRGSAVTAIAALVLTVSAVLWANAFAFSNGAVLALGSFCFWVWLAPSQRL